ncbi:MAG: hypothetical protein ACO24O_08800 [Arenimonas sp.]
MPNNFSSRGFSKTQQEAWSQLSGKLDEIDRIIYGSARTASTPDRAEDRLVPQVFAARITANTVLSSTGRLEWEYSWEEVERTTTASSWATVISGRNNTKNGKARNAYETSIANDGGNTGPGTVTRLPYPTSAVVMMVIDPNGRPWFDGPNPVTITCPP